MAKILTLLLAFAVFSSSARASSFSTDITDWWWNPSESGWGINIALQNDIAFAALFVYDTNQKPVFYVAELDYKGNFVWSGNLDTTTGPWFGGPFNPGSVVETKAGTMTFTLTAINSATLQYTIGGIAVTKQLERTTWKSESLHQARA